MDLNTMSSAPWGDVIMLEGPNETGSRAPGPRARKGERGGLVARTRPPKSAALALTSSGVIKPAAAKSKKKTDGAPANAEGRGLEPRFALEVAERMRQHFKDPRKLPEKCENPSALITNEEFMGAMIADTLKFTTERGLKWLKVHDGITAPLSRYFADNAALVCSRVPLRTSTYRLTFGQVATAFYIAFGTPVPVTFGYEVDVEYLKGAPRECDPETLLKLERSRDRKFAHVLDPGRSGLRISCMPTGTGKTVVTVAALLTALLSDKGTRQAERMYLAAAKDPHTGARAVTSTDAPSGGGSKIAPLVIVFCPGALERNWATAAGELQGEVARLHAAGRFWAPDVRVWQGFKSKETRSIESVYRDGVPTLWVLSASTESLKVLYEHYDVGFRGFALDEGEKLATRYTGPLSPVCGPSIVAQATPETLHDYLDRKGNLLVRWLSKEALPTNDSLVGSLRHGDLSKLAKCMRRGSQDGLVMLPEVLVTACGVGASEVMPAGLKKFYLFPSDKTLHDSLTNGHLDPAPVGVLLADWFKTEVSKACTELRRLMYVRNADVDFSEKDLAFARRTAEAIAVDFGAMKQSGRDKIQTVLRELEKAYPRDYTFALERDQLLRERALNTFAKVLDRKFAAFAACPCPAAKGDGAEACEGGKISFSGDKRECMRCSATYEAKGEFSLEDLVPGKKTEVDATSIGLFTKVFEKSITGHKRVVVYSEKTSKRFFERYDCELLMLVEDLAAAPGVDGAAAKVPRRGPNKHKRGAMVARFNEPPLPEEKPLVLVLGKDDLVGTDLQNVGVIISFGPLRPAEQKQLAGRGLRMCTSSVKDKHVHMYMM